MKYFDQIDALRAIAVLAVIVNHIDHHYLPSGYLGVDVFFVISGFVVMHSLKSKQGKGPIEFLKGFYKNRYKRLYPALLLMFFSFLPFIFFISPGPETSIKTGIASLFAHSNLYLIKKKMDYFGGDASLNFFTHTWTLSVEEQFYFVFPLIFIFCGFLRANEHKSQRRFHYVALTLMGASLIFYLYNFYERYDWSFYLMPARLWQLLLGAYLSLIEVKLKPYGQKINQLGLALLVAVFFLPHDFQRTNTVIITLLTALLLIQIKHGARTIVYESRVMKLVGKMSYSLYLWHWPLIVLLRLTFGYTVLNIILLVFLMGLTSAFSYEVIEKRLRQIRWNTLTIIILTLLPLSTLIIKGQTEFLHRNLFQGNELEAYAAEGEHYWKQDRCSVSSRKNVNFTYQELVQRINQECRFQTPFQGTGPRVLLYGNSYAEQLLPTFKMYVDGAPIEAYAFTAPTCPLWQDDFKGVPEAHLNKCPKLFSMIIQFALENLKSGDVLILATPFYHFLLNENFLWKGKFIPGQEAFAIFETQIEKLKTRLEAKGIKLLMTNSLPMLKVEASLCYQPWSKFNQMCDYEHVLDHEKTKQMSQMNDQLSEALLIDLFHPIDRALKFNKENIRAYKEKDHLSTFSTKIIFDEFKSKLDRALK